MGQLIANSIGRFLTAMRREIVEREIGWSMMNAGKHKK